MSGRVTVPFKQIRLLCKLWPRFTVKSEKTIFAADRNYFVGAIRFGSFIFLLAIACFWVWFILLVWNPRDFLQFVEPFFHWCSSCSLFSFINVGNASKDSLRSLFVFWKFLLFVIPNYRRASRIISWHRTQSTFSLTKHPNELLRPHAPITKWKTAFWRVIIIKHVKQSVLVWV